MKYLNQNVEQVDSEINNMFNLGLPNSAFKRVIPASMMKDLREQYYEYLSNQVNEQKLSENRNDECRPVSTQVIKVNIASLREAGYCC